MNATPQKNRDDASTRPPLSLPRLPAVIRYFDDYDEKYRTLKVSECILRAPIYISGELLFLRFDKTAGAVGDVLRNYALNTIQDLAASTVYFRHNALSSVGSFIIDHLIYTPPSKIKEIWHTLSRQWDSHVMDSLKSLLIYCCKWSIGAWSEPYINTVSHGLSVEANDPYATVRSGSSFLTIDEEAKLVRWIDGASIDCGSFNSQELEVAALVTCSYQFGMRPKQLGMVRLRDCKVRQSEEDSSWIIHLSFKRIKQKDNTLSSLPLIRKIRREWAPIFVELLKRKTNSSEDAFLFGFPSRKDLSIAFKQIMSQILPNSNVIAYDLRHSMAQRLVDAGAGHEELAEALGHSSLKTGQVYFRSSANQAEIINKALGASPTYRAVAQIALDRFITPEQLLQLKGNAQIAGAPHGIPIAGIGGCTSGQPSCPFNPVIACYGCRRFMPVDQIGLHHNVLAELRGVLLQFKNIGKGEVSSPAYLQLSRTINEVQGVIHSLEQRDDHAPHT